jgi:hypothetical protein
MRRIFNVSVATLIAGAAFVVVSGSALAEGVIWPL